MKRIVPYLWFENQAEEAASFYVSIFSAPPKNKSKSKILSVLRYEEEGSKVSGRPKGSVMTVNFMLYGQEFVALNGGPEFTFSGAISFLVNCKTQEEIDYFWEKLSEGGRKGQCGWLTDKYSVTWQVSPEILDKMLSNPDPEKAKRVMKAMLKMKKIDIKTLMQAAE